MYDEGLGTQQNQKMGLELLKKAAGQGLAPAQFFLGKMYAIGRGVQQDYKQALTWYTKAADQGYKLAKEAILNVERK